MECLLRQTFRFLPPLFCLLVGLGQTRCSDIRQESRSLRRLLGVCFGGYQIATGKLISLSAQELLDCDTDSFGGQGAGCAGALIDQAYTFVSKFKGLCSAHDYPYTGTQGKCQGEKNIGPSCTSVAAVEGFVDVSLGPASAGVEVNEALHNYKGGVIDSPSCGTNLDHAVLIVGFGTDEELGVDYWKIKNTWGSSYGENGYFRLIRGKNMCGIVSLPPSYPIGVGPAQS